LRGLLLVPGALAPFEFQPQLLTITNRRDGPSRTGMDKACLLLKHRTAPFNGTEAGVCRDAC
jgi:hypothetical protein